MILKAPAWLMLITNLSGHNPTLRMRLWRAMKAIGAGLLRDGVYLLPNSGSSRRVLDQQAVEIRSAGGTAHLLPFESESPEQQATFTRLFDRTVDYEQILRGIGTLKRGMGKLRENEARQRLAALGREVASVVTRDYFPGPSRDQVEGALADAEATLNARFAPDEPHPARHRIRRRDPKAYAGRTWVTRERLWIDRVASAWLIRRFIDQKAKFLWLKSIKKVPKQAVGFDFDGAEFTHTGNKVTFEVLLATFGLEQNEALSRLGAMVHHLDLGGIPTAEGPGFATIMAGARSLQPDDDSLLEAVTSVLDSLYAGYANTKAEPLGTQ